MIIFMLLIVVGIIYSIFGGMWKGSSMASRLILGDRVNTVRGQAAGWFLTVGLFIIALLIFSAWGNSLSHH